MALNCFQFDLQLLHLTTTFLSTNHLRSLPAPIFNSYGRGAAKKTGKALTAVVRRACLLGSGALVGKPDREGVA